MEVMKTEVHHNSPVDGKLLKLILLMTQEGSDPGL